MGLNNRLIIYFFFDSDGIVDEYNLVMLRDIMKNSKDLFVVTNGALTQSGREKFRELTDQILERENKGFDVGAYQDAMHSIGWDKLAEYEEVVLMNYTIMGPVYPFKEMFDSMDGRELDFWGITEYHGADADPYDMCECGYLREHIQSHFIAVRRRMIESDAFHKYWDEMPVITSYGMSVAKHESYFTHHFASRGFHWGVYVNTDDLKKFTEYPLLKCPKKLLKEKRCPVFKRRSFNHIYYDFLDTTMGEPSYELMEYLKDETDYDVNLIWDNILRTCNQAAIKNCLHLNYILPSDYAPDITPILEKRKIALVMHLFFEDLLDESYQYASSMPEEADVFLTVSSQKMKDLCDAKFKDLPCHKVEVLLIPNRGRDVGSVLVAVNPVILDYDIVCFAHDKKVTQLSPESKGAGWAYMCFESVLKNKNYVKNVIRTFEENPRLGLLTPTPPYHAEYFPTLGHEWGANFANVQALAKELDIHVPMDPKMPPISALGCFFWYRPKAMKKLYDRNYRFEDFPEEPMKMTDGSILHAIERMYSMAVQDAGYYPGWCFSDTIANMTITNLHYMMRELNLALMNGGIGGNFIEVLGMLHRAAPVMQDMEQLRKDVLAQYKEDKVDRTILDSMMHLYYDMGEGYSENHCCFCRASVNADSFAVNFDVSGADKTVYNLRFDPGEAGMIIVEKLKGMLEYEDGTIDVVTLEYCDTNGLSFRGKVLFLAEDPQIYLLPRTDKLLKTVTFSGRMSRHITPADVTAATSRQLPKMTPKLYFDCGRGIREKDTMKVMNVGTANYLEAHFHFDTRNVRLSRLRFDPCEEGILIMENMKAVVEFVDGSKVETTSFTTNGVEKSGCTCFVTEDPQIRWKIEKDAPVRRVTFTANLREDIKNPMSGLFQKKDSALRAIAKKLKK